MISFSLNMWRTSFLKLSFCVLDHSCTTTFNLNTHTHIECVPFLLHLALGGICSNLQNEVSKEALLQWNTPCTFYKARNPSFSLCARRTEQKEKDFCEVNLLLASLNYLLSKSIFHQQCQVSPESVPYNHLITYAHWNPFFFYILSDCRNKFSEVVHLKETENLHSIAFKSTVSKTSHLSVRAVILLD